MTDARILLGSLILASCAVGDDPGAVVARDTLVTHRGAEVSVRIVESRIDTTAVWRVETAPSVDIGGGDSEATSLFNVAGAYRLGDGRIAVLDAGSSQLKLFDAAGTIDTIIGRAGDGPGEFRQVVWFGRLPGDSLLVWDIGNSRLTVFAADGSIAREVRNTTRSSIIGAFSDGTLLSRGFVDLGGRLPDGLERHASAALHLDAAATVRDSIGHIPGTEGYYIAGDGWFSFMSPPFGRSTSIAVHGERLFIADSNRPEVRVHAPDGRPHMIVRWQHDPVEIDEADVEQARRHALADNGNEENVNRMFREMQMHTHAPAFGMVRVDRSSNIWVQQYRNPWDEGAVRWTVFDADGQFTAVLELPAGLAPTDIGADYILGIERDDLDVEHVRLYRLQRNQ